MWLRGAFRIMSNMYEATFLWKKKPLEAVNCFYEKTLSHIVPLTMWHHLFLEFWFVDTWFFADWRHQLAVTHLENVRQSNLRRGKKLGFQLSHKHPHHICFYGVPKSGKPQVTSSRLGTKLLKTISVLMKALSHKSTLLILNFRIALNERLLFLTSVLFFST